MVGGLLVLAGQRITHLYFPQLGQEFSAITDALSPILTELSMLSAQPRELLVEMRAVQARLDKAVPELRTLHRAYLTALHSAEWAVLEVPPRLRPSPRPRTRFRTPTLPEMGLSDLHLNWKEKTRLFIAVCQCR